ncbi:MAG: DUF952 domain-containing protein [Legionella sp.]
MTSIYKILTQKEWNDFASNGFFEGSALDKKDQFIHLAFEDQYPALLEKFFKGVDQIVLVEINPTKLPPLKLKIEANKVGGEKYPHLYSTIPASAVVDHEVLDLPLEPRSTLCM